MPVVEKNILEGTPVTLTVNAKRDKAAKKTVGKKYEAKLVVLIDGTAKPELGKAFELEDTFFGNTKIEHTFDAPNVPDTPDKSTYRLTYHVEVGGRKMVDGAKVFTVWPSKIKVKAKKKSDSSAYGQLMFWVSQDSDQDQGQLVITGLNGEIEASLTQTAPFQVEIQGPFSVTAKTQTGRNLEFTVEPRPFFANIAGPLIPGKRRGDGLTRQQMVTCASAQTGNSEGHDGLGNIVSINVGNSLN
ncbi:MAG TPA: hypothetical protein VFF73_28660, partial [Planctomycetota bacterium]|nr:hypothetical protein [Planctomycetota bacterium]